MNPSAETIAVAAILFVVLAAYALFGGADFGGGIWDLVAGGPERGAAPRELIDESITPVWKPTMCGWSSSWYCCGPRTRPRSPPS